MEEDIEQNDGAKNERQEEANSEQGCAGIMSIFNEMGNFLGESRALVELCDFWQSCSTLLRKPLSTELLARLRPTYFPLIDEEAGPFVFSTYESNITNAPAHWLLWFSVQPSIPLGHARPRNEEEDS